MSKNTLLNEEVRNYISDNKIEEKYNESLNELIHNLSDNPYYFISEFWKNNIPDSIIIKNIYSNNIFDKDFKKTYEIYINIFYKGNDYLESNKRVILNGNIEIEEELKEIVNLGKLLKDFEIKNYKSLLELLNSKEFSKNILLTINIIILSIFSKIRNKDFKSIIKEEIGYNKNENSDINYSFKIINGNNKNKFKFIFLNIESNKFKKNDIIDFYKSIFDNAKNNIINSKAGYNSLKINKDGSIESIHDSINDTIKFVNELIENNNSEIKEFCFIGINIQGSSFYNKEIQKYEFENLKKPSEPEEIEDLLLKICIDKKRWKFIVDPFIAENPIPWHRFNKKLNEKNVSIIISSKFVNFDENLKTLFKKRYTKEDFPAIKQQDFADKLNENLLSIKYNFIDFYCFKNFIEIFENTKVLEDNKFIISFPTLQSKIKNYNEISETILNSIEISCLYDNNLYNNQIN